MVVNGVERALSERIIYAEDAGEKRNTTSARWVTAEVETDKKSNTTGLILSEKSSSTHAESDAANLTAAL